MDVSVERYLMNISSKLGDYFCERKGESRAGEHENKPDNPDGQSI